MGTFNLRKALMFSHSLFRIMRALVIGCGRMGSAAAEDLAKRMRDAEVFVADKDAEKAKETARKIGKSKGVCRKKQKTL